MVLNTPAIFEAINPVAPFVLSVQPGSGSATEHPTAMWFLNIMFVYCID
jgi:hypothetical protein